jgi:hypothetical protein
MFVMVQIFAAIAVVGALATIAALVALHVLPTGLSPAKDAVSAYGISRYRGLYRAQTLATGAGAAALAVALAAAVPTAVPAVIALAALAATRAVISWFPMDAPGASRTATGRAHNLLAFAAFAAASVSGFMVGLAFSSDPGLSALAATATTIGWVTTAASALTLLAAATPALRAVFGLAERLIYLGMLALLLFASVALIVSP